MHTAPPNPILLIHGLVGALDDPELIGAFRGRSVLAPAMLGYGEHSDVSSKLIDLHAQVDHLRDLMEETAGPSCRWHLVGHSVGGAIAALFAASHPQQVASVTSVEGNFMLDDAFWSQQLARMPLNEVEAVLERDRANPSAWLERSGIIPDTRTIALAQRDLAYQPATTLKQVAQSVVGITSEAAYLQLFERWLGRIPLHLIAGERSADGWHVPEHIKTRAATTTVLPDRGHLMMVEAPQEFAEAVLAVLQD